MVSLTGSVETGKWIAGAAADTLKHVHLELGGKAPVVIFDDADMETALETIAGTGYYNAGQDCTAATRVLARAGSTTTSWAGWPSRPRATRWATCSIPTRRSGR
jgi:betaine-aldehyde dehydrogenase